ncbi:DUF4251 domain-containing protein [Dysgonomonas sp. 521]|uniref:DUF4251 domain-containing protein n=1 Tax=Dysgonomonas sp. 521 TaxID=2302932 RepID=UPI0013D48562|nr:DUF4251 domain-containing protein [Dysgonomonas sp. 521]NDV93852.1 DUF4251 domain-containing protein [Dysgonomonas sp. 521]
MRTIFALAILAVLGFSCKSGESLTKEETISRMKEKIESTNYTFVPQTALPMGGKTVNLNYSYSLKVSKDTVDSYLPYFGRAYTAPMSPTDGGIKFTSKDFEYSVSEKKNGMWDVTIITKDIRTKYTLNLSIGDTGYATLTVNQNNRQPISFYGKIE